MTVLRTQGVESESPLAFAALQRLLRPVMRCVDRLPEPQARALRTAFGEVDGSLGDRFLVFVAAMNLLAEAGEQAPVLAVVDDAHWLDDASAAALLFVARRLEVERVGLLFAARVRDVRRFDSGDLPTLAVGGVDAEAAGRLLAERTAAPVAAEVRNALVAGTGGNPLALVELTAALRPAQLAGTEPLPARLPLTEGVERAFLDRYRRLPPGARTVLLVAAGDDSGRVATVRAAAGALGADDDAWARRRAIRPARRARRRRGTAASARALGGLRSGDEHRTATCARRPGRRPGRRRRPPGLAPGRLGGRAGRRRRGGTRRRGRAGGAARRARGGVGGVGAGGGAVHRRGPRRAAVPGGVLRLAGRPASAGPRPGRRRPRRGDAIRSCGPTCAGCAATSSSTSGRSTRDGAWSWRPPPRSRRSTRAGRPTSRCSAPRWPPSARGRASRSPTWCCPRWDRTRRRTTGASHTSPAAWTRCRGGTGARRARPSTAPSGWPTSSPTTWTANCSSTWAWPPGTWGTTRRRCGCRTGCSPAPAPKAPS